MNRRQVLARAGAAGLAVLAGCIEGGPAAGGGDGTPTTAPGSPSGSPTRTPTDASAGSPTPESAMIDTSFTVTGRSPGTTVQRATVSFGEAVRIAGTTTGNDGCYTAELGGATYEDGVLTVTVRAVEQPDGGACTQAIVEIDYEATVDFEGSLPERVVVEHDSMGSVRTVADVQR